MTRPMRFDSTRSSTNLTSCRCTASVCSQKQPSSCAHSAASWWRRRSGNMLSNAWQGSLQAILLHLARWHMDLGYFGRGLLGSDGYWHCTAVAVGFGRRLAVQRETDAALHRCFRERGTGRHTRWRPGFCDRYSGLGSSNIVAKRYRATNSASSTSKFSEARLYDFIHKQQGVRFGPFRLDLEQRPPRGLCARKELKLAPLSLLETEQAQPSAADSP